ncbi:hypothetical protein B0J13DRAFT_564629 [Dactylonectria estremocensis]|uniref:Zn(2)-C6 fungal-type domain-containing protein n=1 Tax=Dactylonectria estremocensis TaxID=1079267 RepID=A0A9P9IP66_9HYPO|nr:hypothetical protein B0J13DRAFT_564629 [Dactylonectria estremocensis]
MAPNPAGRKSAPYGQACVGCSKAKCRCISREPAGSSCERCHRLCIDCQPSSLGRKLPMRRGQPNGSKNNHIEEKLGELVTLLKSQVGVLGNSSATTSTTTTPSSTESQPQLVVTNSAQHIPDPSPIHIKQSSQPDTRQQIPPPPADFSAQFLLCAPAAPSFTFQFPNAVPELPPLEAQQTLGNFRKCHLQTFPFLHLPDGLNAQQLISQRPCLWLAIRVICSKSSSEKSDLDTQFRAMISQRVLIDADRDLDLLLGLVAWLSWMMDRNREKRTLCVFSNIAASLVFDLRLDRSDGLEYPCKETNAAFAYSYPIKQMLPAPRRTNEERRAVLACFCISACISDFLRTPSMRWTPHMEDCLQYLISTPEVPGDRILVAVTQLMQVMDDLRAITVSRNMDAESSRPSKTPPSFHVKALLANLDNVKKTIPPDILNHRFILPFTTCAEASINEFALSQFHEQSSMATTWIDHQKVESVFACIKACKECIDNWLAFSTDECYGMHVMIPIYFARCTHILYRLSLTEDPCWDRQMVRNAVDLLGIMEAAAMMFTDVALAKGMDKDPENLFVRGAAALRQAIPIWAKAFSDVDAMSAEAGSTQEYAPMDLSEDAWMDLLTNWNGV